MKLAWCWYDGRLDDYLPFPKITSTQVLGDNAPATKRAQKQAKPEAAKDQAKKDAAAKEAAEEAKAAEATSTVPATKP